MSLSPVTRPEVVLNSAPTWFRCAPDWNWSPRALPDYDLWFVAAGRGHARLQDQDFALRNGVCFVWRPGDAPFATHEPSSPLEVFACHFDWHEQIWELPLHQNVFDGQFFELSAQRSIELWARGDASGRTESQRLITSLLWQLKDESLHPRANSDTLIENLAAQLQANWSRNWSLDEMARSVHLSRAQLVRRFRARYGVAPIQWRTTQRIEAARHLLLETDGTLETIARKLGWNDAAHFSRQFKATIGVSPGRIRK